MSVAHSHCHQLTNNLQFPSYNISDYTNFNFTQSQKISQTINKGTHTHSLSGNIIG